MNPMEKYSTAWRRVLASFIDGIVFIPLMILDYNLMESNSIWILIAWLIVYECISFLYSIFMHAKYGQTIGKMLAGITVMNIGEERHINLKEAIRRDLVWIIVSLAGLFYFSITSVMSPGNTYENLLLYDEFYSILVMAWTVIELLSMITNKKRRAVHDYIAGSVVVITGDYIGQYKHDQVSTEPDKMV
jgi:uncharacterized RDD family membrane protein YckC